MSKPVKIRENQIYIDTLDITSKQRYLSKCGLIDDLDPYQIPKSEWSTTDVLYPCIQYPDIVNYLIYAKSSYTLEEMKAWKSIDAYNLFTSGWVREVAVCVKNGYHVVRGKVLHSQKLREKPTQPWIIAEKTGIICTAHCDCMAGLGEVCTHVASLMFAVEATVKLRDSKTVTQAPAYWLLPAPLKQINYRPVAETDFTSAQMKKKNLDEAIATGTQTTPSRVRQHKEVPPMSETEFINFLHEINKGQVKPAIMSIVQPFSDNFIPKEAQRKYPKLLSDLFDEEIHQLPLCEVRKKCNELKIEVTVSQIEALEQATRGQFMNKLWQKHRTGRLTASKFKAVCHTNSTQPAPHLIRNICYPDLRTFKSIQTSWGLTYEPKAKHQYIEAMKKNHTNFMVRSSGLVIHITHPEIGASPDGIISCDCCGIGSLEIKCPYTMRDMDLSKADIEKSFLVRDCNGGLTLDRRHEHYYQVQCQLFVCDTNYADFVVWTRQSIHIERIEKCHAFWEDMLPKALHVFRVGILPELLARCYTRLPLQDRKGTTHGPSSAIDQLSESKCLPQHNSKASLEPSNVAHQPSEPVWCFCQDEEYGQMVACDDQNCQFQWFHFDCVGITSKPKGKWYCPECIKSCSKSRVSKVK